MGAEGHNSQQNDSSSSSGQASTSGSRAASKGGEGDGPQPKIYKHNAPKEHTQSDEVRAHNEDMEKRHDRPNEKSGDEKDKVDKGFWSGKLLATFLVYSAEFLQVMVVPTGTRDEHTELSGPGKDRKCW